LTITTQIELNSSDDLSNVFIPQNTDVTVDSIRIKISNTH
jgi:hypothetical protein